MSDELNNSFEPSNEETDTPKATLNGVDFGSVEVGGPKKGLVAAIAVGAVALIVALICVIVFLMKKPSTGDERVSSVSTTNSVSETSASDETPASETESDVSENDPDEAYGFPETVDYSFGLTEEGFVKDADLSTVADLNLVGTEIPFSAVDYIDDKVDADILSVAQQYAFYDDDPTLTVENGHTINLTIQAPSTALSSTAVLPNIRNSLSAPEVSLTTLKSNLLVLTPAMMLPLPLPSPRITAAQI